MKIFTNKRVVYLIAVSEGCNSDINEEPTQKKHIAKFNN